MKLRVVALLVFAALSGCRPRTKVSRTMCPSLEDYDGIKLGMTRSEVARRLGPGIEIEIGDRWNYVCQPGETMGVEFDGDIVIGRSQQGLRPRAIGSAAVDAGM